jgi:hypothetical protein
MIRKTLLATVACAPGPSVVRCSSAVTPSAKTPKLADARAGTSPSSCRGNVLPHEAGIDEDRQHRRRGSAQRADRRTAGRRQGVLGNAVNLAVAGRQPTTLKMSREM